MKRILLILLFLFIVTSIPSADAAIWVSGPFSKHPVIQRVHAQVSQTSPEFMFTDILLRLFRLVPRDHRKDSAT